MTRSRSGWGRCGRTQSPAGIKLIIEHNQLFRTEPEASGKYLRAVIAKASSEQYEQLVDRACAPTHDHGQRPPGEQPLMSRKIDPAWIFTEHSSTAHPGRPPDKTAGV